jgi:enamine deaminase RidA (YjgF/YER057c/UK114 family)|tara:strand:+ start:891 stop:1292 length:402 start_codon:yes stop_codon:yes gene_type:complete
MEIEHLNPDSVYEPPWKFTQAVKVRNVGTLLFLSGIVAFDQDGNIARGEIVKQAEVVYDNIRKIVESAGGTVANIVKMNTYIGEDWRVHRDEIRDARLNVFPDDPPASTLLQVAGFADPDYLIEIEAIAVLDE